jgi:hypothetical protein
MTIPRNHDIRPLDLTPQKNKSFYQRTRQSTTEREGDRESTLADALLPGPKGALDCGENMPKKDAERSI